MFFSIVDRFFVSKYAKSKQNMQIVCHYASDYVDTRDRAY